MEKIRITAGSLKGRILHSPQSSLTHPMGAREKLALFNMINAYLRGATVLDAFAGSGALGIEAISREASSVTFIEKNPKAAQTIRQNLRELGIESEIFSGNVVDFTTDEKFGVILADPPYDDFKIELVQPLAQFLDEGGVMVLSHPNAAPDLSGLELQKTRQYASAHLSVYVKG